MTILKLERDVEKALKKRGSQKAVESLINNNVSDFSCARDEVLAEQTN